MTVIDLNIPSNQTAFAQIVGTSQQAIAKQVDKGVLPRDGTMAEWLDLYLNRLREQAAGRGGNNQERLATARAEESEVKAALGRLTYHKELKTVVLAEEAADMLQRWATFTQREYKTCVDKLVNEIQSVHAIEINPDLVLKIAEPTANRVADYAEQLGRGIGERFSDIQAAEENFD
jgi:hypothetical protein